MNISKTNYKEKLPSETVSYLRDILDKLNIKTEEKWHSSKLANTYSLRLSIKNTTIGSNGKGITKDFARASAYGEFFERLQNNHMGTFYLSYSDKKYEFCYDPYEKYFDIKNLKDSCSYFVGYLEKFLEKNGCIKDKNEFIKLLCKDYVHKNNILCLPFYNIVDDKVDYFPLKACKILYASNGMAGGNTPYEAIVEGISEILERASQREFLINKITPPDIPDEYIEKFPNVYKRVQNIRKDSNYKLIIKDCSLGKNFPVVATAFICRNTGRYGIKFGSHPNMGIAIERTLTEATQGIDIPDYARYAKLDLFNKHVNNPNNIGQSFLNGVGKYYSNFFDKKPSYQFSPWKDVSNYNNKELVMNYIDLVKSMDYKVFIRDVSYLGFPSYYIIIPQLSENICIYHKYIKHTACFNKTRYLINDVSKINKKNCGYIIKSWKLFKHGFLPGNLKDYLLNYNSDFNYSFPFGDNQIAFMYLVAMCYFAKHKFNDSYNMISKIENEWKLNNCCGQKSIIDLNIIKNYIAARCIKKSHVEALSYLEQFYTSEYLSKIDTIFKDESRIFTSQFPIIDKYETNNDKTDANNIDKKIMDIVHETMIQNPIDQLSLRKLF